MRSTTLLLVASTLASSNAACGGDSCFVRGTGIATANGAVPIEQLRVGDEVLAYAHAEGRAVVRRVVAVHASRAREVRVVRIEQPGGGSRELRVTPSHPFWVASRGAYVPVRDLRTGDELLVRDPSGGVLARGTIVTIVAQEAPTPTTDVFNISVEGETNYFAEGVLVHNKEPVVVACDAADVAIATPVLVTAAATSSRYRIGVTATRRLALEATAFGRAPGAARADVPVEATTSVASDGRGATVELVVPSGLVVTVSLSVTLTAADGATCSRTETVDLT